MSQVKDVIGYLGGGRKWIKVEKTSNTEPEITITLHEWDQVKSVVILNKKSMTILEEYLSKFIEGSLSARSSRKISPELSCNYTMDYYRPVIKLNASRNGVKVADSLIDYPEILTLKEFLGQLI